MAQSVGTQITCPNCRQPFSAILEQIIDVGRDPQAKARLLAGRINLVTCPNCGYQTILATPLVYHDPTKELLLVHVPMELGLPQREQDKIVGSLTNAILNSLPQDQRKGYLLTPKMALTLPSLVEMVLEKDGITKDVIEGQREKMRLVETMMQTDAEDLPELVMQYDAQIDEEFFTLLAATAEAALANGRRELAEQALALREKLVELSTVGRELMQKAAAQEATIQEVAQALNSLGEHSNYEDFVNLAVQLGGDGNDEKLQVLVGLARPVMDYQFFDTLTKRIDKVSGDEKARLAKIRDRLVELTSMVDQQNEAVIRRATDTLRGIMNSQDLDSAIRSRIELLDDTFLAVLSANIQNAEQAKDLVSAARFKTIFEKVVSVLQESAPPAVRFINELMQQQSLDDARGKLAEGVQQFGSELVDWMDMLMQDLAARGNNPAVDRLHQLREEAVKLLPGVEAQSNAPQSSSLKDRPAQAPQPTPDNPKLIIPQSFKRPRK